MSFIELFRDVRMLSAWEVVRPISEDWDKRLDIKDVVELKLDGEMRAGLRVISCKIPVVISMS